MDNQNLSRKDEVEIPQQLSKKFLDVLKDHLAIFTEHYRQPISELSAIAYAEDLQELTPEELDAACSRARKNSEFMPVSAAILKAHTELAAIPREEYLGPKRPAYLNEPIPIRSKEEQEECDKYSEALRKTLLTVSEPFRDKDGNHTAACLCMRCQRRRANG